MKRKLCLEMVDIETRERIVKPFDKMINFQNMSIMELREVAKENKMRIKLLIN